MATTRYELRWGIGEGQRQVWVDYGDGSFISKTAGERAGRALKDAILAGYKNVGLFVNGEHVAGRDFAKVWAELDGEESKGDVPEPIVHKTRTFLTDHGTRMNWRKARVEPIRTSRAVCTCGWRETWDNREFARRAARRHREAATA